MWISVKYACSENGQPGRQRFANNAQDFAPPTRRDGGRSDDAVRHPPAHDLCHHKRRRRGGRYLWQLNLFGDVFERVRADYVEHPDDTKLIESAITGMLAGLDPHSSYMDPKSLKDLREETSGEFGGLGMEVTMEDGLIKVV